MASLLIFIGLLVIVFLVIGPLLSRVGLSPIVGYLVLGWVAHQSISHLDSLVPAVEAPLSVLARIGLVLLLFHIGLESHLKTLVRYVGKAGVVALVEILVAGVTAWLVLWLFGAGLSTSLVVAVALSATSIGVATISWSREVLEKTKEGAILLDLASIDDIVGVLLMAFLFGFLPHEGWTGGIVLALIGIFALIFGCYLFSLFVEPLVMKALMRYEQKPAAMLTIVAIGLIIASISSLLHISFAIGAFFAGIAFSRDARAVRLSVSMESLLDLFVPFFFFWIGYQTVVSHLLTLWPLFLTLLLVTLLAKFLSNWGAARAIGIPKWGSLMIGASMIPRAEVTMVVMENGLVAGFVSEGTYSMVSLIVLLSCIFTPLGVKALQKRMPAT
jgi:Na+:H+ antiporter